MKTKTFAGVNAFAKMIAQVEKDTIQACVNTVNIQAAKSRKIAQEKTMPQAMTLRNKFSQSSVLFTQCPKSVTRLDDIVSEVGATSRASYLALQETGGTRKNKNGKNLSIHTTATRRGSNSNLVQKKFWRGNISQNMVRGSGGRSFRSRKARFVAKAAVAAAQKKFIRMRDAIFQVANFRKAGDSVNFKTKMILNLKHQSVQVQKNEWLKPATDQMASQAQAIFNSQMDKI